MCKTADSTGYQSDSQNCPTSGSSAPDSGSAIETEANGACTEAISAEAIFTTIFTRHDDSSEARLTRPVFACDKTRLQLNTPESHFSRRG